jgi:hypothetical protein
MAALASAADEAEAALAGAKEGSLNCGLSALRSQPTVFWRG